MELLLFILAGFGVTTIITKGDIFEPLRNWLDNGEESIYDNFFGILITCPLCVGFWVGVIQSLIFDSPVLSNLATDIDTTTTINWFWWAFKSTVATIFDGGLVAGMAWTLNQVVTLIQSAFTYYDTQDLYMQYKMASEEKDLLDQSTNQELLND
jgi:hypothetical protein